MVPIQFSNRKITKKKKYKKKKITVNSVAKIQQLKLKKKAEKKKL